MSIALLALTLRGPKLSEYTEKKLGIGESLNELNGHATLPGNLDEHVGQLTPAFPELPAEVVLLLQGVATIAVLERLRSTPVVKKNHTLHTTKSHTSVFSHFSTLKNFLRIEKCALFIVY